MNIDEKKFRNTLVNMKPAAWRCSNVWSTNPLNMIWALRKNHPRGWVVNEPLFSASQLEEAIRQATQAVDT